MNIKLLQNPNLLNEMEQPTLTSKKKRMDYADRVLMKNLKDEPDVYSKEGSVSFKAWKINTQATEKATRGVKEKLISSELFSKVVHFIQDYEVATGAIVAFLVGISLRIPTILSLPKIQDKFREMFKMKERTDEEKERNKQDNEYAAVHTMASITMGLITTTLISVPLIWGKKFAKKQFNLDRGEKIMEKITPQAKDLVNKIDRAGNKLSTDYSTPMQTFEPVLFKNADVKNLKNIFETESYADAYKKAKPNELYIKIDRTGLEGKTDKITTSYIRLDMLDRKNLEETNGLGEHLDLDTVFDSNGVVRHPDFWRNKDKSKYTYLNADNVRFSSSTETLNTVALTDGTTRKEIINGLEIEKPFVFQNNGGKYDNADILKKGTPIDSDMTKAAKLQGTLDTLIGWIPDIITKIPIGLATVAMYPPIMRLFGVEKSKSASEEKPVTRENKKASENMKDTVDVNKQEENKTEQDKNSVNFKAKATNPKQTKGLLANVKSGIEEFFSRFYAEKIYKSEKALKLSEFLNDKLKWITPTSIMMTGGSVLMSGSYMYGTLTNDKLDKDRKKTLAVNQALCCIVPAIVGAVIDGKLKKYFDKLAKEFSGAQEARLVQERADGKINEEQLVKARKYVNEAKGGIGILKSLVVFTLVYRYLTPVLMTPVANWISDHTINKKANMLKEQEKGKISEEEVKDKEKQTEKVA